MKLPSCSFQTPDPLFSSYYLFNQDPFTFVQFRLLVDLSPLTLCSVYTPSSIVTPSSNEKDSSFSSDELPLIL